MNGRSQYLTEASQALDLDPAEAQPNRVPEQHTFSVQEDINGKAVLRKVDRHILPFFFSLALLCSIDRGAYLADHSLSLNSKMYSRHWPFQAQLVQLSITLTAVKV